MGNLNASDIRHLIFVVVNAHFRWKKTGSCEWTGVFANRVWILSQNNEYILYRVIKCPGLETTNEVTSNTGKSSFEVQSVARKGTKTKHMCEATFTEINKNGDISKTRSDQSSLEDKLLRKYFRLDVSLEEHYAQWSKKDPHFKKAAVKFTGVRILSQDPVENLFSFICSSNNNIARFIHSV